MHSSAEGQQSPIDGLQQNVPSPQHVVVPQTCVGRQHSPATHDVVGDGHTKPQVPQFCGSVFVLVHAPPQHICSTGVVGHGFNPPAAVHGQKVTTKSTESTSGAVVVSRAIDT